MRTLPPSLDGCVNELSGTRPWLIFLAVLMFLGGGILVIMTVILTIGSIFDPNMMGPDDPPVWLMVLMYGGMALIYIVTGVLLIGFSSAIKRMRYQPGWGAMEDCFTKMTKYWRTMGILSLVGIVFIFLAIIIGGIAGAMGV